MNWTDVPSDIVRKNIDILNNTITLQEIILMITHEEPLVLFSRDSYTKIIDHLSSNLKTELGGILLGNFYVDNFDNVKIITIENIVESQVYISTSGSLNMGTEIWTDVNKKTTIDNSIVVGWYHSHPNLGAFFSSTDRYTQKHFFNHDYNLGLVMDPIRNEIKYFLNSNSKELNEKRVLVKDFQKNL